MKKKTINALIEMGMPADNKGFGYIVDAMCLFEDSTWRNGKITNLYEKIGKMNGTTASRVERAIRHAIEVAWGRGEQQTVENIFGYTISAAKGKPTNSEFIAMIADKLRLELKTA